MTTFQQLLGRISIRFIRLWVRLFGKTVRTDNAAWLKGPVGPDGVIADEPYKLVAEKENLTIENDPDGALVHDFDLLNGPGFDVSQCDPNVRHFYEHSAKYQFDVWSETRFPGRLFLWMLVSTVSRYMNQLNFPVFGLEMSRGMTSEILSLKNREGKTVHTGWYRRLKGSGRVVYTGFYSHVAPPNMSSNCVKVVFPLPRGNASVFLRPAYDDQQRFQLISMGKKFGDPGFYRTVEVNPGKLKVLYMKSLHEVFTLYTDDEGTLRCDHTVHFLGMSMLRLHYRIRPLH